MVHAFHTNNSNVLTVRLNFTDEIRKAGPLLRICCPARQHYLVPADKTSVVGEIPWNRCACGIRVALKEEMLSSFESINANCSCTFYL